MINSTEAAICKTRGHDVSGLHSAGWARCKWCGTWLREVKTVEERENDPPENEWSPFERLRD